MSAWTYEYCKHFLKLCKAVLQGNKKELIDRCILLKHLTANDLENLMPLSKIELRSVPSTLTLPCRQDMSKDVVIRNVSNAMLGACGDVSNGVLAAIEEEERNADVF